MKLKNGTGTGIGILIQNSAHDTTVQGTDPTETAQAIINNWGVGLEDDANNVAWVCVWITVASVLLFWLGGKLLLSGSGTSVQQIQQIKPSDVMQLTQ